MSEYSDILYVRGEPAAHHQYVVLSLNQASGTDRAASHSSNWIYLSGGTSLLHIPLRHHSDYDPEQAAGQTPALEANRSDINNWLFKSDLKVSDRINSHIILVKKNECNLNEQNSWTVTINKNKGQGLRI